MKNYTETKIGRIIEEEFDSRMENAVFEYIFDVGAKRDQEFEKLLHEEFGIEMEE